MRKIIKLEVLLIIILLLSGCIQEESLWDAYFPDEQFDIALRKQLNNLEGAYSKEVLEGIISINFNDEGITSIEGIENLPNLATINLPNNLIEDFNPLKKTVNIENLTIANTKVKSLDFLINLKKLVYLDISNNEEIENFDVLKNLIFIKTLVLENTNLSNIDFLIDLDKLETVNISNTNNLIKTEGSTAYIIIKRLETKGIIVNYK